MRQSAYKLIENLTYTEYALLNDLICTATDTGYPFDGWKGTPAVRKTAHELLRKLKPLSKDYEMSETNKHDCSFCRAANDLLRLLRRGKDMNDL